MQVEKTKQNSTEFTYNITVNSLFTEKTEEHKIMITLSVKKL